MKDMGSESREKRHWIALIAMLLILLVLIVLNVSIGSIYIPISEIGAILCGRGTDETAINILQKIRLPRMFAGILAGGALSLSGFLLQTFFNNPIASPYVLGISSGAKLTVSIVMVLVLGKGYTINSAGLIMAAFVGAMLSMGFVLLISEKVQRASMLIVSGVMIGYICSAITDFIITFADESSIVNLHNWSLGSFSGISWDEIRVMAGVIIVGSIFVFLLSKPIGAWQLGEGYAQNLGVNIRLFRILLVLLSSLLSACVTAFAGPVSFVGIAVPHLVKGFLKTSKPLIVIPFCFFGGSIFCLACDLIARTLFAPTEISISSVTAVFGAPVVIFVMVRKRMRV